MKVQIRPAIYGEIGVLYEAYQVIEKFSWWTGSKVKYKQLYWRETSEGFAPTDCFGWAFNSKSTAYWGSGISVQEVVKVIKECYGNSVEFVLWRPQE